MQLEPFLDLKHEYTLKGLKLCLHMYYLRGTNDEPAHGVISVHPRCHHPVDNRRTYPEAGGPRASAHDLKVSNGGPRVARSTEQT
jgi:hypothetical protein